MLLLLEPDEGSGKPRLRYLLRMEPISGRVPESGIIL